jgi:hypothetical protein
MPSSGMLHRVTLVRTDVSEQRIASIIRVTRIGELRTLTVTRNRSTQLVIFNVPNWTILVALIMEAIRHNIFMKPAKRFTSWY